MNTLSFSFAALRESLLILVVEIKMTEGQAFYHFAVEKLIEEARITHSLLVAILSVLLSKY